MARDNRSEEGDSANDTDDEGASGIGLNPRASVLGREPPPAHTPQSSHRQHTTTGGDWC